MIDIVTDAIKDHHTLYALIIGVLLFVIIITQSKHAGKFLNIVQRFLDNRKINYDALLDTVTELKKEADKEKTERIKQQALRYKIEAEYKVSEQLRIQQAKTNEDQAKTIHDLQIIIKNYAEQAEKEQH